MRRAVPYNYLCVPFISFKIAKKEEIVRRLEGDIASLQETVKSYAEEVRQSCFTINVRLICDNSDEIHCHVWTREKKAITFTVWLARTLKWLEMA